MHTHKRNGAHLRWRTWQLLESSSQPCWRDWPCNTWKCHESPQSNQMHLQQQSVFTITVKPAHTPMPSRALTSALGVDHSLGYPLTIKVSHLIHVHDILLGEETGSALIQSYYRNCGIHTMNTKWTTCGETKFIRTHPITLDYADLSSPLRILRNPPTQHKGWKTRLDPEEIAHIFDIVPFCTTLAFQLSIHNPRLNGFKGL